MFRCKNCQHVVDGQAAGECDTPAACPVCGAGVIFSSRGIKTLQPENWEILAPYTPVKAGISSGSTHQERELTESVKSAERVS